MATPFTFFRKNQQSLMVVLVVLAMLIFTMDSAFSSRENQFVLLGVLVGGALFSVAGISQGRWLQYGIGGAIFGALAGWVMPGFVSSANTEVVSTSIGAFDEQRLYDLGARRSIANTFMYRATESAYRNQFDESMASQFAMQFAMRFGFGHSSENEDLIFGEFMKAEAEEMGISVSDAAITDFINENTLNALSQEEFKEARSSLMYQGKPLRDEDLYDILRDEIMAYLAYQTLQPESSALPATPEYTYSLYRRTNVSQRLNTAMLNVDDFVDQVAEPTETEVVAAFEAGKALFPYQDGPDTLGFRQFPKVRLAALALDYRTIEKSVAAPTDEEVAAYYEENKDELFRREVRPEAAAGDESTTAPEVPAIPGSPEESGTDAAADPKESDAAESPDQESDSDTPAEAGSQPEPADGTTNEPAGEPEPAAKPEGGDAASPQEPAAEETPSAQPAAGDGAGNSDEPAGAEEPDGCFFDEQEESTESQSDETGSEESPDESAVPEAAGDQKPAEPAGADKDPQSGEQQPAGDETAASAPLTIPAAGQDATGTSDAQQPLTIPADAAAAGAGMDENPFPEVQYEYTPLDENLKESIREDLLRTRVEETLQSKMSTVMNELKVLENERRDFRFAWFKDNPDADAEAAALKTAEYDATMIEGMQAIGEAQGLEYVEIPFVTYDELADGDDYPLGTASALRENVFSQEGPTTAATIFGGTVDETQYFSARHYVANQFADQLGSDAGEQHFAWWILDYEEAHIPTLDEPGVREQIVLQLKRIKARELAKDRAEELAASVREGLQKTGEERTDMVKTLEGVTSTGKDDAPTLAVRQTMRFSWMEVPRPDPMSFQQGQPRLSTVSFGDNSNDTIRYAGNNFMQEVFERLGDGEVGVVPDELQQRYFVVQVVDRSYNAPNVVSEEGLWTKFMTDGKTGGFSTGPVHTIARMEVGADALREWKRQVWRKYGVDPDAPPEA